MFFAGVSKGWPFRDVSVCFPSEQQFCFSLLLSSDPGERATRPHLQEWNESSLHLHRNAPGGGSEKWWQVPKQRGHVHLERVSRPKRIRLRAFHRVRCSLVDMVNCAALWCCKWQIKLNNVTILLNPVTKILPSQTTGNGWETLFFAPRNEDRWYNLRVVLNKRMLHPRDALQYGGTLSEVVTDFIGRIYLLRQRSPTGDVVADLNNELYRFSLEGTLLWSCTHSCVLHAF